MVCEVSPDLGDGARAASLLFLDGKFARRVRNYPAAWQNLSDADLERLSWTT